MKLPILAGLIGALSFTAIAGDQSVTVKWDPNPASDDVVSYRVYYGLQPTRYTSMTEVVNTNAVTLRSLTEGTNWFFAVTAVNREGLESGFSEEVMCRIPNIPSAPQRVTNYWNAPPMKFEILMIPITR